MRFITQAWDLSPWSWAFGPASFLIRNCYCFWIWMLGHWTCQTIIGLVILKLGLQPSFILNEKLWLFLALNVVTSDLSHTPSLDLSFWSWAFGPAWFLKRGHFVSGLGCCDIGLVTPASDLSFWSWAFGPASFLMRNCYCFWTWMLGHWTCHTSVGLVILKLGLRPSFFLNAKL